MSDVAKLHEAVKHGDLAGIRTLLDMNRALVNARSVTDARGFGQAAAARLLLEYGADVSLLDDENTAVALCWAAFFGRPEAVAVLLAAGSPPSQRNRHGLTPLGCAIGGQAGRWRQFSDAADIIRSYGGHGVTGSLRANLQWAGSRVTRTWQSSCFLKWGMDESLRSASPAGPAGATRLPNLRKELPRTA